GGARTALGVCGSIVMCDIASAYRGQPLYLSSLRRRAAMHGIDTLCRFVGHCPDMPAALTAADVVLVPSLQPPLTGRTVAEAQAMGRPVVTTAIGMLPENVLCPPRSEEHTSQLQSREN